MAPNETTPFHSVRVEKVRNWLLSEQAAFVAFDPISVQWLTGFTGSNGCVYLDSENFMLFTDRRYILQAPEELMKNASAAEYKICSEPFSEIAKLCLDRTVVLDGGKTSWKQMKQLSTNTKGEIVDAQTPIQELRAVKDTSEIKKIAKAANIANQALSETLKNLDETTTEKQMASDLEYKMKVLGATDSAYPPIVASGSNSAYPHATPTEMRILKNSILLIDVGALYEGYRSDMTRTILVNLPSSKQSEVLELVKEAQRIAIAEVKPGVLGKHIDFACRNFLKEKSYGDLFNHGAGHGVGLEIHEYPRINSKSEDVIREGMVIAIEPGVYLPDSFGARWEDLLVVTSTGFEYLTKP